MSRRCLRCVVAALALIAGLATAVAVALEGSFARVHSARVFPLGYEHRTADWVDRRNDAPPARADVTVYGDSRAYHWPLAGFAPDHVLRNEAHGNITSSQLRLQLFIETPIVAQWSVVQVGINDLHPLGAFSEHRSLIVDNLKRNLEVIADQLLARSEHVVLLTVIPPGQVPLSRRWFWDRGTLVALGDVNRAIRHLPASRPRLTILDAASLMGGDTEYLPDRFVDRDFFLHLSSQAYAVLNSELQRLMSASNP